MFLLVSKLENTCYILSKTKQSSPSLLQNDNLDNNYDLNLLLTRIQVQKSFYNNNAERKTSKKLCHQDYNCLTSANETTYDNIVTMDLTSKYFKMYCIVFKKVIKNNIVAIICLVDILDNFIHESSNMNKTNTVNVWEEIGFDTPTRIQDLEDVDNKIITL